MVIAGAYDVLSAKIAERAGFPAVVLTGDGVAASYLGEPSTRRVASGQRLASV